MKRFLAFCLMQVGLFCGAEAQKVRKGEPRNAGIEAARKMYWIDYFQGDVARISKSGDFGLIDSNGRVLCPPKYDMIFDFEGPVARVTLHGAYGLINRQGQEVHPVNMTDLTPFSEGIANYRGKDSWAIGLVNEKGKEITGKDYSMVSRFKEGRARFVRDTVYGIIDKQGREKLLITRSDYPNEQVDYSTPPTITEIESDRNRHLLVFENGLAPIARKIQGKQKFGFIDTSGKVVIPIRYDNVTDFKNGFAAIQLDSNWGIINSKGEVLINPQYKSIYPTINGRFVAHDKNYWGIVEEHNQMIAPFKYGYIRHLFKNLFEVFDSNAISKGRWAGGMQNWAGAVGVLDDKGAIVIPIEWDGMRKISDLFGQVCAVQSRIPLNTNLPRSILQEECRVFDERGFIDPSTFFQQETIIELFRSITPGIGVGPMQNEMRFDSNPREPLPFKRIMNGGATYVYLNRQGRQALKDTYSFALPFKKGVAIAAKDPGGVPPVRPPFSEPAFGPGDRSPGKYGLIDSSGKVLIPFEYEEIIFWDEQVRDVVPAKKRGKWGAVDFRNKVLVPFAYDYVFSTAAGIIVRKGELNGLMDFQGAVLLPLQYDNIEVLATGMFRVKLGYEDFYVDKRGKRIQ